MRKKALVALGANVASGVGIPEITALCALEAVSAAGWRILATSRFYRTPCFPAGAGPDYVNAVVSLELGPNVAPGTLLESLHRIEQDFGRERIQRWGSRTLDLDLLAIEDAVAPDSETVQHWMTLPPDTQATAAPGELILPHPRIQDRGFVLVPLVDVAADWRHPLIGKTAAEMLADLPPEELEGITPL